MNIHRKFVDMNMDKDMDRKFYIHSKPEFNGILKLRLYKM